MLQIQCREMVPSSHNMVEPLNLGKKGVKSLDWVLKQ